MLAAPVRSTLFYLSALAALLAAGSAGAQIVSVYHTDDVGGAPPSGLFPPGCDAASPLLGSTGDGLYDIDPLTGSRSNFRDIRNHGPVTEIEFRADGVLFGTTGGVEGGSEVVTIEFSDCPSEGGCARLIFDHGFGNISGLEFVGDTLYGALRQFTEGGPESHLVKVLLDEGEERLDFVGPIDVDGLNVQAPVGGLAYDVNTQTMYGVLGGAAFVGEPVGAAGGAGAAEDAGTLLSIDLQTGDATVLGALAGVDTVASLEPGPNGLLYGGTGDDDGSPGTFFTVDPTTTPPAVVAIGNINNDSNDPLSGISQDLACALQGDVDEILQLWIDGGDNPGDPADELCKLGPDGGDGGQLCGGDVLVQLVGSGSFTNFEPDVAMNTLIHHPACVEEECPEGECACALPAGTKQLRMVFRRGGADPPLQPRRLGVLTVDSRGADPESPSCVNVAGVGAAGANLQFRPIATGAVAKTVEFVPEAGEVWLLLAGAGAVIGLARRRAGGPPRR
jgi:hypothetical protein